MDDTAVIQADATSALSNYLHLLVCIPDDLDQRISRDAYALRRLETSGTDQLTPCHRRRVWTRQDQRRLKIQQGLVGGPWPRCRTERYIDQVSPRCKAWLREAITEAREDGTVAAVGSKLDAADKAVDAVLSAARDIAQDEVGMSTFSTACLALKEIASGLIPWTKPPTDSVPGQNYNSEHTGHSDDFRSMRWFGITYSFTPNQAAVMKVLYEHWVKGVPEIGQETLLLAIDPEAPPDRLNMVFRKHPAWMKVIISGRSKGSYRLVDGNEKN